MQQEKRIILTTTHDSRDQDFDVIKQILEIGRLQEDYLFRHCDVLFDQTLSEVLEEKCVKAGEKLADQARKVAEIGNINQELANELLAHGYPLDKSIAVFYIDYSKPGAMESAVIENIRKGNFDVIPSGLPTEVVLSELGSNKNIKEHLESSNDSFMIMEVGSLGKRRAVDVAGRSVEIIPVKAEDLIKSVFEYLTISQKFANNSAWLDKVGRWQL